MLKLNQIKPGAGFETVFEVTSVQPISKYWECFMCKTKGKWKTVEEVTNKCPKCGTMPSPRHGEGLWVQDRQTLLVKDETTMLYLDLWNKQVNQYHIGDKLQLTNGYARDNGNGGVNISTGRSGMLRKIEE